MTKGDKRFFLSEESDIEKFGERQLLYSEPRMRQLTKSIIIHVIMHLTGEENLETETYSQETFHDTLFAYDTFDTYNIFSSCQSPTPPTTNGVKKPRAKGFERGLSINYKNSMNAMDSYAKE
jgi:hypothetical protein